MDPIIRFLDWGVTTVELKAPYHLSFATLEAYETVWVRSEDELGRVGLGEAVALPGYGWEKHEDVREAVAGLVQGARNVSRSELVRRCRDRWTVRPFAASAVLSSLEFPDLLHNAPESSEFPLNWPVAGNAKPDVLYEQVLLGLDQGYSFIKVKVGMDLKAETANLPILLGQVFGREFKVLFDANQGYAQHEALAFAHALAQHDSGRLLWFEQPLDRDDWSGLVTLCARSTVPVILDESVYSEEHIYAATKMGAYGVKLKLFKHCGPSHCLQLAKIAADLGLAVVFGNGVATDVGNLSELLILSSAGGLFSSPVESNGFNKLSTPLLGGVVSEQSGRLLLTVSKAEVERRVATFNPERS